MSLSQVRQPYDIRAVVFRRSVQLPAIDEQLRSSYHGTSTSRHSYNGGDVKDRSVLRLREHNAKTPVPTENNPYASVQQTGQMPPNYQQTPDNDMEYYSESELDMADMRARRLAAQQQIYYGSSNRGRRNVPYYPSANRPASALPPGAQLPPRGRDPPRYPPSYRPQQRGGFISRESPVDPVYGSRSYMRSPFDESSSPAPIDQIGRSGSATPIIDEEARMRMLAMERQLVSLSSLVHQALSVKGQAPIEAPSLDVLRRDMLANGNGVNDAASDAGSIGRLSDLSALSAHSSTIGNESLKDSPDQRRQIADLKNQIQELQAELKHIRRVSQMNAQSSKDLLKEAFERVNNALSNQKGAPDLSPLKTQLEAQLPLTPTASDDEFWRHRLLVDGERHRHSHTMKRVDNALMDLEKQVEELRVQVVSGNRRLRVTEVEAFINSLSNVGRLAAMLKSQFPNLHGHLKAAMSAEMEKVVREEKFLNDEPGHLDAALRRCKKLTNTIITMKKLALVQDDSRNITSYSTDNGGPPVPPPPSSYSSSYTNGNEKKAPAPPPKPPLNSARVQHKQNTGKAAAALDNLLEELETVGAPAKNPNASNGDSRDSHENTPSREAPPKVPPLPQNYTKYATLERKSTDNNANPPRPTSAAGGAPPPAMEKTSALDDDLSTTTMLMRSAIASQGAAKWHEASSSESVNSQDGGGRRAGSDRVALLEQRQAELAQRQQRLNRDYQRLQELAPNVPPGGPPYVKPYAS